MARASFQFYPGEWRKNANLRRCSEAARGVWMDVLCVLADSEEFGIVRWPLKELASAAGAKMKYVKELVEKNVLKGCDSGICKPLEYTPTSGRKKGPTIILIPAQNGPIWYSSKQVRDEYKKLNGGGDTRFKTSSPEGENTSTTIQVNATLAPAPFHPQGEGQGDASNAGRSDGSSTSSSTSIINTGEVDTRALLMSDWPEMGTDRGAYVANLLNTLTAKKLPRPQIIEQAAKILLKNPEAPYSYITSWANNLLRDAETAAKEQNTKLVVEKDNYLEQRRKLEARTG